MLIFPPCLWAQGGGGAVAGQPLFHVVRSVAGSKGEQQSGRYVIDDPRDLFYVPADKQVIVYFEWEGPLGPHQFEGQWKNPEGKAVVISDFTYNATTKRFGGYWSLDLSDTIEPGMWSLEAHVDGEVTGSHSFQIVAAAKPASTDPTRHLLPPSEIYKRALASVVSIERLDAKGERTFTGSGFFVEDGLVLTTFQVIDGARDLRITLSSGRQTETHQVAAWDRWQDWVLLRVDTAAPSKLARAAANSWSVGDRCFTLESPTQGDRTIVDESITGIHSFPQAGERLSLSFPASAPALGSPVLNEYGEIIGVLGGNVIPGISAGPDGTLFPGSQLLLTGSRATPIQLVPAPQVARSSPAKTLDELAGMDLFTPPVRRPQGLVYGILSGPVEHKKGEFPSSIDQKTDFSLKSPQVTVTLVWSPKEKGSAELALRAYDLDNHTVVLGQVTKVNFRPGQLMSNTWDFNVSRFKPGTYRVEVLLGTDPIWRAYFNLSQ